MNKAVFVGKDGFRREEVIKVIMPEILFAHVPGFERVEKDDAIFMPRVQTRRFSYVGVETTHIYKEL